jgi:hypothetical protein
MCECTISLLNNVLMHILGHMYLVLEIHISVYIPRSKIAGLKDKRIHSFLYIMLALKELHYFAFPLANI